MLLLRSNGTLLHMKDCIITFVKLIISKKHNFILYNALTNRDSPNFPLPSNPLPQIVTSNPRLQPDTHFAVDMFPYKTTELFQESGFKSKPPKKPGNTTLSGLYLSFLDINTTVSTCTVWPNWSTGCTSTRSYPWLQRYFKSRARVAESQLT